MKNADVPTETVAIFFYGLHMDVETLRQKGIIALEPRVAYAMGRRVVLRSKAMLVASEGDRAAGVVCRMSTTDIQRLYQDITGYEQIALAVKVGATTITAVCMVHRAPQLSDPVDDLYAGKLKEIYRQLGVSTDLLH